MTRSDLRLTRTQLASVNWPAVALFYAIACGLSFALRHVPNPTAGILPGYAIFTSGLGPIVAALVVRLVYPATAQQITLLGHRPGYTLLALLALLAVLVVLAVGVGVGMVNKLGQEPHVYGGLMVVSAILYGFFEEMGWRGFLQNALQSLPTLWRVLITAALWGCWHLTGAVGVAGSNIPIWGLVGLFILGSWGLGAAAERTRSVLVAACMHEVFTLPLSSVGLGLMLLAYTVLFKIWPRCQPRPHGQRTLAGTSAALICCLVLFVIKPAQAQTETIPHQEIDPSGKGAFPLFDADFYKNQLFLLGETHGFKNAQVVDLALLKHLNQRIGVRHYIAEVDPTKAYYINQYFQTGQDSTLRLVFASWIANKAQWANQDFFRKIQAIRAYNQTLPARKRIRFVGIDEVQDRPLVARQLIELTGNQLNIPSRSRLDSLVTLLRLVPKKPDSLAAQVAINWLAQINNSPADYRKLPAETLTELRATLQTLAYRKTVRGREKTIFTTFRDALSRYNLTNEKLYGFWGVAHVWQAPLADGRLKFAGMIQASDLPMKAKTVSITCSYVDSFMMVPSQYLPPFWQEKGKVYSRVDKFNSNGPMMTVSGTDELIKQSQPNTMTLFKLPGTAAGKAPITATYSPFMPAEQRLNFDPVRPTTDYFQYIVLIRNSEMTEGF